MRVQQRKLFLDFAEKFSLPANGPEKKRAGAKKKRLPGVIVGRAFVLVRCACGLLEQRADIIGTVVAEFAHNAATASAAAMVDSPRAMFCYHQVIRGSIQPGGKAVQGVKVNLAGSAQGFQFRRVKAGALLNGGKRGVLLTKQLCEGERVNAQA